MVEDLLAACGRLRVLVTSRAPLRIASEQQFEVAPLATPNLHALPSLESLSRVEAVDLFVYRIGREIGSLAAALGGLDTLVFTAGIGENAHAVRSGIGQATAWLGVRIDEARNASGQVDITGEGSAAAVLVLPTDEERAVAGAAARLWRERSR